jgi:hypothetical protein
MYIGLDVKYPLFLAERKLEFSRQTVEKTSYQISWNSMRTDRHDEAIGRFSQFCERA